MVVSRKTEAPVPAAYGEGSLSSELKDGGRAEFQRSTSTGEMREYTAQEEKGQINAE